MRIDVLRIVSKLDLFHLYNCYIRCNFLHVVKYARLDELHENDPGLAIDAVLGSVGGVVSMKCLFGIFSCHINNFMIMLLCYYSLPWIIMRSR